MFDVASHPQTPGTSVNDATPGNSTSSKKKKTRCPKCNASVGVIGFPCRCGGIFCLMHRYANEHSCSFDYKEHGAEEIRRNNPQVVNGHEIDNFFINMCSKTFTIGFYCHNQNKRPD